MLAAVARGQDVVIASPTVPYGPWDVKPTPTGRIVLDFIRGRIPVAVGAHLNLVDVEDVAQGHISAWRRGRSGERYLMGNWNTTLPEVLSTLSQITGRRPPPLKAPVLLVLAATCVDALLEGVILRREPYLPLEAAGSHSIGCRLTAPRRFRVAASPEFRRKGLQKSVRWFQDHGYA